MKPILPLAALLAFSVPAMAQTTKLECWSASPGDVECAQTGYNASGDIAISGFRSRAPVPGSQTCPYRDHNCIGDWDTCMKQFDAEIGACDPVEICKKHHHSIPVGGCSNFPVNTCLPAFDPGFESCRAILDEAVRKKTETDRIAAEARAKVDAAARERDLAIVRDAAEKIRRTQP